MFPGHGCIEFDLLISELSASLKVDDDQQQKRKQEQRQRQQQHSNIFSSSAAGILLFCNILFLSIPFRFIYRKKLRLDSLNKKLWREKETAKIL